MDTTESGWALAFTVHGDVKSKERPRLVGDRVITPAKTKAYETQVMWSAKAAMTTARVKMTADAVVLRVTVFAAPSESWSKKKIAAALANEIPCMRNRDLDNQLKAIQDGMNKIVYDDDCQIVELHINRLFASKSRAEIRLNAWRATLSVAS